MKPHPTWLVALTVLSGCAAMEPALDPGDRPGDFTLRLTVGPGAGGEPDDPGLSEPGQYLVTPDRDLRVSLGPGADRGVYPPRTAVLTPAEMDGLWRLTLAAWEAERGGDPEHAVETPAAIDATIRADGQRLRLSGTLGDPATRALVAELVRLRGG